MENKKAASGRVLYFDLLRIVATLAVMILHVSGQNWRKVDVTSFTWQTFNFYDGIVRWSVPIFVMLSGALFLERNVSLEKLYKKNILRIVTAFAFWSVLYALINRLQGLRWRKTILQMIEGPFHMWFLFMIVGLYMIVPFAKMIVDSPVLTRYFLILSFFFTFLIPQGLKGIAFFSKDLGGSLKNAVTDINLEKWIVTLSNYSFGAYLVHALLIDQLDKLFGINSLSCNPVLSVPSIVLGVFILSFLISALVHRVPVLNKYIV